MTDMDVAEFYLKKLKDIGALETYEFHWLLEDILKRIQALEGKND